MYTYSSGVDTGILLDNFCVNWWFFRCPWSPWTMTVYLDEHKRENGKNKSVKQYTMIIIARSRRKFRNQNWRYGYRNNHFGLQADFSGLHIFSGTIPVFRIIQGHFQGHQQFQGFSGFSEVADHPVVMNLGEKTWKLFIKGLQSVRYLGPKIWELVPNNIKYSNSLRKFKKLIKSWKPEECQFYVTFAQTFFLKSSFSNFNCYYRYKFWSVGVI